MYTFLDNLSQTEFNTYAQRAPYYHLLQSYEWSKVKHGFKPRYVGVQENGELVATALILIRSLPLGLKLAYIPRGPLCDYSNDSLLQFFTENLKSLCKNEGCMFIRIDPAIEYRLFFEEDKDTAQPTFDGLAAIETLKEHGYIHRGLPYDMHDSFQPRVVASVPLNDQTVNNYQSRLKKALKYKTKRQTQVSTGRHEYLDDLANMIKLTEERQGVHLRNKDYFKLILDSYPNDSGITIATLHPKEFINRFETEIQTRQDEIELIKEKSPKKVNKLNEQISSYQSLIDELENIKDQEKIVIGALLWVVFGKTINLLYAGTDVQYTKFYPQELIYHQIVLDSLEKGLEFMDMGGVQGQLDDGLFTFKSQFKPLVYEYIGEFDLPLSFKYKLFNVAWNLRLKMRKK